MSIRLLKHAALALAVAVAAPGVGVAGPEFLQYEGRNAIHEGQGGERKTVEGIDFWMSGDPPHRYQVLGSLTDRRHKTGLYGAIRMSGLDSDIARAAKQAGGDAVVLVGEDDDVTGLTDGSGTGVIREMKAHDSKYLVVRYLPDAPASSATPSPPPVLIRTSDAGVGLARPRHTTGKHWTPPSGEKARPL